MNTENNSMHVTPKHKWCMKKNLVKNLETENFSVLIDRASIEYQSSQADSNQKNLLQFQEVEKHLRSVKNLEKWIFWKIEQVNVKTPQSIVFHEWNAWVWD